MDIGKLFDKLKESYNFTVPPIHVSKEVLALWEEEKFEFSEDYTEEMDLENQAMLSAPTTLPLKGMENIPAWLWRLSHIWGDVKIYYNNEYTKQKGYVSFDQMAQIYYTKQLPQSLVGWNFKELKMTKIEIWKEYYVTADDNKCYKESFMVEIKLFPNIARGFSGKF